MEFLFMGGVWCGCRVLSVTATATTSRAAARAGHTQLHQVTPPDTPATRKCAVRAWPCCVVSCPHQWRNAHTRRLCAF